MALTPKEGSGRMLRNQIIQTTGRQRFPRREPGGGPVAGPAAWHPALCHRLAPRAAGPADPGAGGAAPAAGSAPGARPPESPWFGPAAPGASRHTAGSDACGKLTRPLLRPPRGKLAEPSPFECVRDTPFVLMRKTQTAKEPTSGMCTKHLTM